MEDSKMTRMASESILCGDNGVLSVVANLLHKQRSMCKEDMLTPNSSSSAQGKDDVDSDLMHGSSNEMESISSNSFAQSLEQVHALATANLLATTQRDIVQQLADAISPNLSKVAGDSRKRQNSSKVHQNKKQDVKCLKKAYEEKQSNLKEDFCATSESKILVCSFDGCNRKFATQTHLKYHEMTHTNNRQFECPDESCGKAFFTAQSLKVHLRTHTGEKPFKCSHQDCGKTFTTAGNLKNHERIHTGKQPFLCDFDGCNRRFTEYSSLYKHKLTHSGDKPFECKICNKKFTQSGSRRQHLRRHHIEEEIRNSLKSRVYSQNGIGNDEEQNDQSATLSDIIQSSGEDSKPPGSVASHSTQVMVLGDAYSHPTSEAIVFPSGLNEHLLTVTSTGHPLGESNSLSFSHSLLNPEGMHETNQDGNSDDFVILSQAPMFRHDDQTRDIVYASDMLDHEGVTRADYHLSAQVDCSEDIVAKGSSYHHPEESRVQTDVSLHHSIDPVQSSSAFHPEYQSPLAFSDKKSGISSGAFVTSEREVLPEDFIGTSEVTISTSSSLLSPDEDVTTASFIPVKANVTSLLDWDEHMHKH